MRSLWCLFCCFLAARGVASRTVLLAGATGKSGVLAYAELRKLPDVTVRVLVRNVTKAKALLGCSACDEKEGVFIGDVTQPSTLVAAVKSADVLVSTIGSDDINCKHGFTSCSFPKGAYPKDINWEGNKALATAFAEAGGRQAVLMSTMDTTVPDNFLDKLGHSWVVFYSLQAEAWLMGSGLNFTIVKACGLTDTAAGKHKLLVGHDDKGIDLATDHAIPRADVARVLAAAVASPGIAGGLRFDLCSQTAHGTPTKDPRDVFRMALYPWDPREGAKAPEKLILTM